MSSLLGELCTAFSVNPQERCYLYDNDELDPQYRVRFEVPT